MTDRHNDGPILAVCGGPRDAEALELALALGAAEGRRAEVLAAEAPPRRIDRLARSLGLTAEEARRRLAEDAVRRAETLVEALAPPSRPPVEARLGRPWEETIRAAIARSASFVVKGAEPESGAGLFQSVDQHILRKCPCPVWLRRTGRPTAARPVLAAVDVADGSEDLALAVLNAAARVARLTGATIHALHVWDAPAEGLMRRWAQDGDAEAAAYARDVEEEDRAALERLFERFSGEEADAGSAVPVVRRSLLRGSPRQVIPEEAARLGVDTLAIGTVGRVGVPGLIIGNTAEDVLNAASCSILAVKPPGYVSPVV